MERGEAMAGLRAAYAALIRRLEPAPHGAAPPTVAGQDGSPHVEWRDARWFYIITERGLVREERSTTDRAELLYWLLADVTFGRAVQYELRHRKEGQDFRRILFARQIEELASCEPRWAERRRAEINTILRDYPYRDDGTERNV